MSLFGALTAAISGLTAQSRALGHISDNVANSQTIGYKRVDTNFVSYITQSNASVNEPGPTTPTPSRARSSRRNSRWPWRSVARASSAWRRPKVR